VLKKIYQVKFLERHVSNGIGNRDIRSIRKQNWYGKTLKGLDKKKFILTLLPNN